MAKQNAGVQTQQTGAVQAVQKPKDFFLRDDVKAKFTEIMGKRSSVYITSVLQVVAQNKLLADADVNSIYQAAMVAATLDLPINNNLGFAYIIPYGQKAGQDPNTGKDIYKQVAQFQLGYKGFVQLALRSGQFKTISATPIYNGQLIAENPLTGFEFDFKVKAQGDPIGYAAYFSLINGFEKTIYMSQEEIAKHGSRYSKTFNFGTWKTDFQAMALKTVTKLLLSKFAPLSIEMQKAIVTDQSVINNAETEDVSYVDADPLQIDGGSKENERFALMVDDCKTLAELESLRDSISNDIQNDLFNQQLNALS